MSIEAWIVTDQIPFRLKLALISEERFELPHIVPVPIATNHTVVVI